MKHDYEAALDDYNTRKEGATGFDRYDAESMFDYWTDTIIHALKLAAKLEQEPSKGMILAAENWYPENLDIHGSSADIGIFQAMLDQARKEIE